MARRGGPQLQTEIKTEIELQEFTTRSGLIILEVYTAWCGPSLGMVSILRKAKLEMGGDNLHLAICQSDTIESLKRFHNKSEPTFLFVVNQKAVNIFFGSDAPKLLNQITKELEKLQQKASRPTYGIAELQPVEAQALKIKLDAIEKVERMEAEAKHKKRTDYLNYCTDLIMENLPDAGVTIFGPQVNRNMFKMLTEPADQLKMQCKDRKFVEVSAADFEVINYACKNPLPQDIIEQLDGKELLVCFWKIDKEAGSITTVLANYANELTKERVAPPEEDKKTPRPLPPILSPLTTKFQVEVKEGEVWDEESSSEEGAIEVADKTKGSTAPEKGEHTEDEATENEEENEEDEEDDHHAEPSSAFDMTPGMNLDLDLNEVADGVEEQEEEEVVEHEPEPPKPKMRTKQVTFPPIWVANNRRTHAALIYVFFRIQTSGFLPPDPLPEPPHVIVAFEASRKDDIMEVIEEHREDIPLYGFFTSDVAAEAKLIATSTFRYDALPKDDSSINDRFVLKVHKVVSDTVLLLAPLQPTYCSTNVKLGKQEALIFFPENYTIEEPEVPVEEIKKPTKSKKSQGEEDIKKGGSRQSKRTTEAAAPVEAAPTEAAPTEAAPTEATPTEDAPTEAAPTEAAATQEKSGEEPEVATAEAPTENVESANEQQPPPPEGAAPSEAAEPTANEPAPTAEQPQVQEAPAVEEPPISAEAAPAPEE